jgi:glycine/D-amino acid oxidase-like deaminating enzyme
LSAAEPDAIEQHYGQAGERLVELVRDSAEYLFSLIAAENIACEAEQTGWFQPAHSAAHVRLSERRHAAWVKRGAPCQMLDGDATAKLLGSDYWYGGMLNPTGGHINPLMLARGLAHACEQAGVQILENSPVNQIARHARQWRLSCANGHVDCEAVLLATNAYSGELSTSLEPAVARSVVPVSSWQMSTQPISENLRQQIIPGRQAVSDTRGDLHYFRYDARNSLISGAALMLPVNVAHRLCDRVGKRLTSAFPQLGKPSFTHIWSGYVGITPDHFPHFHELGPGYWAALGFNGRGVALSISLGRELAGVINRRNHKDLALPFTPHKPIPFHPLARRIARGALVYYRWRDGRKPKG